MPPEKEGIGDLLGSRVVLDTATPYVYIGTLKEWQENFVVLADVDVHDMSEGRAVKDVYILEACRHGVRNNRRRVLVCKSAVVSVSRLEDVVQF